MDSQLELEGEIWKLIPFGDNRYSISSLGRIYNSKYKWFLKIKTLNNNGYPCVTLYCPENRPRRKAFSIHRLLAEAFIPNLDNLPQVNHIDCCRNNNNLNNLEWVTLSQNTQHSYNTGRIPVHGSKHANSKLDETQVKTIRSLKNEIDPGLLADYFKIHRLSVLRLWRGVGWRRAI